MFIIILCYYESIIRFFNVIHSWINFILVIECMEDLFKVKGVENGGREGGREGVWVIWFGI